MAGNLKGWWGQKREELALQQRESSRLFYIPSPVEDLETHEAVDERAARAKHCTEATASWDASWDWFNTEQESMRVTLGRVARRRTVTLCVVTILLRFLEGVKAGFKAASIACIAIAVPTLTAVRTIPWFKANLNYTGQALIISAATIATYFIVTDHTIHECSRQGSYDALVKRRSGAP